jgi:CBS domain containing-hemolysin-like protein
VVVGEMVPKTIALRYPTEVTLLTTRPMPVPSKSSALWRR